MSVSPSFSSSSLSADSEKYSSLGEDTLPPVILTNANFPERQRLPIKRNISQTSFLECSNLSSTVFCDDDSQSTASNESYRKSPRLQSINEVHYDDDDPRIKRKAQNRVAQRAFRERKERYVKKLESKIKQIQDNHVRVTAQLQLENQQLKSIICRLREHLCKHLGIPVEIPSENKSWPANISSNVNLSCTSSFKPLQIRPSDTYESSSSLVTSTNDQKKQKKNHLTTHGNTNNQIHEDSNKKTASSSSSQQIKFSISTPASLRANSYNEFIRKNEQIPTVQLYPDHQHPANILINRNLNNSTNLVITPTLSPTVNYNSSDSITSVSSDEDEKNAVTHGDDKKFSEVLKSFLDTHENFDISTLANSNDSSTKSILKQLLRMSSGRNS